MLFTNAITHALTDGEMPPPSERIVQPQHTRLLPPRPAASAGGWRTTSSVKAQLFALRDHLGTFDVRLFFPREARDELNAWVHQVADDLSDTFASIFSRAAAGMFSRLFSIALLISS